MAILKCKMCGGDLNLQDGITVAECEYCGTRQTVPNADDEKKLALFARANRLRAAGEFDKAVGIYEAIVADFPEEAEAYWGLVLCSYGIEYVDDPATGKKIPTCHRSSFESVLDDANFEQVMENADLTARAVYREEAKQIEELRKGIIAVSNREEPYDIFICYKESDEEGERTIDSVLAQDIYELLTEKGYRVFFARISLEDKLGSEYEPYIFAALHSAKIMLAFGTDYEYYNAVWVKNEWSRFLQLIAAGEKKTLIPCYKNIDAYDMPKEFARLQAQDLGKVGALQDLLRGIKKVLGEQMMQPAPAAVTVNAGVEPLLKRVSLFLEDGKWQEADEYCEKVLDQDPECARAYLGKLLVELRVSKQEELAGLRDSFENSSNYQKVLRFGNETLAPTLKSYIKQIKERNEKEVTDRDYQYALYVMRTAKSNGEYLEAASFFEKLIPYLDSAELAKQCKVTAETIQKDAVYVAAMKHIQKKTSEGFRNAIILLGQISGWKDADEQRKICSSKIEELKQKEEATFKDKTYNRALCLKNEGSIKSYHQAIGELRKIPGWKDADQLQEEWSNELKELEELYQEYLEIERKRRRLKKGLLIIGCSLICLIIAYLTIFDPRLAKYGEAKTLWEEGKRTEAVELFETLGNYRSSEDYVFKYRTFYGS